MAIAFLLLGLFLTYQALQLSMRSLDGGPGPGLLPAALGVAMVLLSARLALADWRERVPFGNRRRVGILLLAQLVVAVLLDALGFVLAAAAMMVLLLVTFNQRHRLPLAALGVAGSALAYALFHGALKVQLPADPLGLWR